MNETSIEFQEGYEYFSKSGSSFNDNPYVKDSQQWENWQAGFGSALSELFNDCE